MRLEIRLFGDEVLRQKAVGVVKITPEIKALVENMFETMYFHQGLGLAGPQVGVPLRITVMDILQEGTGRIAMINPAILDTGPCETMEEGCLSFPEVVVPVERAATITVEFTTPGGKRKSARMSGVAAQAVQHEIDHLDGVLLVDHMGAARRALLAGRLRRLRARGAKGERR
ncbi:MAG: peptide deformylase [Candidatus Aureabacteria bacterium]|nr:peptide deformylase [Candidatus Auribacterota bacterium]